MVLIVVVLLIALLLGAVGFAGLHLLWWIALVLLALWLLGFVFRTAETAGSRRRRWYRW